MGSADLVVGPWTVAVAGQGPGTEIARAVADSRALKVLLPTQAVGWYWAGLGSLKTRDAVRHAVRAVKQVAGGEDLRTAHGLSAGAVVAIVVGALVLLLAVVMPLLALFAGRLFW